MKEDLILIHTGPCVKHLVTSGMQVRLPSRVMLLHVRDEQETKFDTLERNCVPATCRCGDALREKSAKKARVKDGKSQSSAGLQPTIPFMCFALRLGASIAHNTSQTDLHVV